jgi:hypothetical protein
MKLINSWSCRAVYMPATVIACAYLGEEEEVYEERRRRGGGRGGEKIANACT